MTLLNANLEQYDAIVVGTGVSGGWAAKELCENGLKTLVLERGRMVKTYRRLSHDAFRSLGYASWRCHTK